MRLIDADALAKKMQLLIRTHCRDAFDALNEIDNAPTIEPESLRPQAELRVEISNDFKTINELNPIGWHRRKFYCPGCDQLIKSASWNNNGPQGWTSILKTDEIPNYCPRCGAKVKGAGENA